MSYDNPIDLGSVAVDLTQGDPAGLDIEERE